VDGNQTVGAPAERDLSLRPHPRFALFDSMEDKGMELARSHSFQEIIRQRWGSMGPSRHLRPLEV
jgi:hypothetical protein